METAAQFPPDKIPLACDRALLTPLADSKQTIPATVVTAGEPSPSTFASWRFGASDASVRTAPPSVLPHRISAPSADQSAAITSASLLAGPLVWLVFQTCAAMLMTKHVVLYQLQKIKECELSLEKTFMANRSVCP
jgi:hypothetical protein